MAFVVKFPGPALILDADTEHSRGRASFAPEDAVYGFAHLPSAAYDPRHMTALLHYLHDPALDGPTNMARDEHLLHAPDWRPAALRIYAWTPPTISLGYFQRCADLAQLPPELRDLAVVRRTTGGGAILHDREITYCLVIDDALPWAHRSPIELYRLVHECWRTALGRAAPPTALAPEDFPLPTPRTGPFFCFEKPGCTDLMIADAPPNAADGGAPAPLAEPSATGENPLRRAKLLGSAQRRIPGRILQHGSLMLGQRYAAHPGADLGDPPAERVAAWRAAFVAALSRALELVVAPAEWTPAQLADVAARRAKYAGPEWTTRR